MNSSCELVERVRAGDDEAFRLIFERYARPIISCIYDMVGDRQAAEELTQETFVRAYRNLEALQDTSKLSTWLFGIAKNVGRETLYARRRDGIKVELEDQAALNVSDSQPEPDVQLLNKELNSVIREALSLLNEDKRLVFTLKVFQHLSYQEIAEVTGFSLTKIKTDLHRAKRLMRGHIRPYLEMSHEL